MGQASYFGAKPYPFRSAESSRHIPTMYNGGRCTSKCLDDRSWSRVQSNVLRHFPVSVSSLNSISLNHWPILTLKFCSGSTIPWAIAATFKGNTEAALVDACEVYVRAFEASNCTYQAEYLRKMRKLILLTVSEIRGTSLSKADENLQNHILRLYRWTGDGTGLAL